ncbi:rhodanese-like domain-containing protein [Yoonia sp. SS1-5]|uniref:Rhodanese-like domain-containing protein n=1 Tax=Yoonia rhodophyticola TaxID=3137370 RepID=A0AAN0MAR6_9RHOB
MKMFSTLTACACFLAAAVHAQDVAITPDMTRAEFAVNGQNILIERNQDADAVIEPGFAKTSRACPPFCIHPMSGGEGVETVGEIELIDFIDNYVEEGTGLLVDSRIPSWFEKGTIPSAINIPFTALEPTNQYRDEILQALGGVKSGDNWDYSAATDLLLSCNGPWCDQSPRAIQNLLSAGYPAEKIRYYRGGMQLWLLLGLTTAQNG